MKSKINPFWGFLTLALVILALVLCVVGSKNGVLLVKTDADPNLAVISFFDAVESGRYEALEGKMENYASLGLDQTPRTERGQLEWDALLASYHFTMTGVCTVKGDTATQMVEVRYLDLAALEAALIPGTEAAETPETGEETAGEPTGEESEEAPEGENPEETDDAGERARAALLAQLRELLEQPEEYYTTVVLPVTLHYVDGQWLVQVDDALLTALSGGKA